MLVFQVFTEQKGLGNPVLVNCRHTDQSSTISFIMHTSNNSKTAVEEFPNRGK